MTKTKLLLAYIAGHNGLRYREIQRKAVELSGKNYDEKTEYTRWNYETHKMHIAKDRSFRGYNGHLIQNMLQRFCEKRDGKWIITGKDLGIPR